VKAYADTGFLVSLYLEEATSDRAQTAMSGVATPVVISSLTLLEMRNAFNLAITRGRITPAQRDVIWEKVTVHFRHGVYTEAPVVDGELYVKAREMSDRHTPTLATRTLDLMHVAATILSGAKVLLTFDERQRRAALAEGLTVLP